MKSDFLRIIFDIITLIVLVVLIFYIIMVFIGIAMGNDLKYIGYLNSIADVINNANNAGNGINGEVFINNYDYNYVFVLTNNNGWYLQLYHCFPPNVVVGLLSVKIAYWNVSITNNEDMVFAPALAYCKLIKQRSLNVDQINISIQGLNDNAGLLVLDSNDNNLGSFIITMPLIDNPFSYTSLAILNETTITCNNEECTYTSSSTREYGSIYCAPNPNINSNNNNLPYNSSDCVELSGFPQNPQVKISNLEGQIINSETLGSRFQMSFPLLYFAGSLPPTVMYIEVNSNTTSETANINIYLGETVST